MTPHFTITRTRHHVVSVCERCGLTSGLTRSDTAAAMWQRRHRVECDTEKEKP